MPISTKDQKIKNIKALLVKLQNKLTTEQYNNLVDLLNDIVKPKK